MQLRYESLGLDVKPFRASPYYMISSTIATAKSTFSSNLTSAKSNMYSTIIVYGGCMTNLTTYLILFFKVTLNDN